MPGIISYLLVDNSTENLLLVCPATGKKANGNFGTLSGCQPDGQMTWEVINRALDEFPDDNTLKINFSFLEGKQTVSLVDLLTTICGIAIMY